MQLDFIPANDHQRDIGEPTAMSGDEINARPNKDTAASHRD